MAKTYNTISTVNTGDVYTATAHNAIATNVNNYRVPPMVRCSPPSSITNNTDISWGATPTFDTDEMFSSGAATRISIKTSGVYLVSFGIFANFSGTSTGEEVQIYKTNVVTAQHMHRGISNTSGNSLLVVQTIIEATATTDYFTAVYTNTGGTITGVQSSRTWFAAAWLGQAS